MSQGHRIGPGGGVAPDDTLELPVQAQIRQMENCVGCHVLCGESSEQAGDLIGLFSPAQAQDSARIAARGDGVRAELCEDDLMPLAGERGNERLFAGSAVPGNQYGARSDPGGAGICRQGTDHQSRSVVAQCLGPVVFGYSRGRRRARRLTGGPLDIGDYLSDGGRLG